MGFTIPSPKVSKRKIGKYSYYKLTDYLYDITYSDYLEEPLFFKEHYGACSSFRKGNIVGRKLDWHHTDTAIFIVHTPNKEGRFATLGIAANFPELDEGSFNKDMFKYLPHRILDGINEKHLVCNTNVVPVEDAAEAARIIGEEPINNGRTTGTHPGKHDLSAAAVVRFVLDYCESVDDALEKLEEMNVYAPNNANYEYHYMISDLTKTAVVEFINNLMRVVNINYMTNFYLSGFEGNLDTVYGGAAAASTEIPSHSQGIERFKIILESIESDTPLEILNALNYSKTYTLSEESTTEDFWYSEYLEGNLTTSSTKADLAEAVTIGKAAYNNPETIKYTWWTTYSVMYDIENTRLTIIPREGNTLWTSGMSDNILEFGVLR